MKSALSSVFFLFPALLVSGAGLAQASATDAPASLTPPAATQSLVPVSAALTQTAAVAPASSALSPTAALSSALTVTASSALSATAGALPQSASLSVGAPAPTDAAVLPPGAPALPDVQVGGQQPAQAAEPVEQNAIPAPGKVQAEPAPSPYKFTNFLYGFLGGALVGVSYGILTDTSGQNNVRNIKAGLYGVLGGSVFGTLSLCLGATTPEPVKPPQVGRGRPVPGLQLAYRF